MSDPKHIPTVLFLFNLHIPLLIHQGYRLKIPLPSHPNHFPKLGLRNPQLERVLIGSPDFLTVFVDDGAITADIGDVCCVLDGFAREGPVGVWGRFHEFDSGDVFVESEVVAGVE